MASASIRAVNDYMVKTVDLGSITIAANGFDERTVDVSETGYTPVGVIGYYSPGSRAFLLGTHRAVNSSIHLSIANILNDSRTSNVSIAVLYRRN